MSSQNSGYASVPTLGSGAVILVVERNPVVQRLERYFLEQAGFSVEFTADGLAALARAQELRPAILITEILVPKLDGLSLCRALKSDAETRNILVTIFSHLQAEDRATEAGADAFLTKPVDEELLIATVERLLALTAKVGVTNLMVEKISTGCHGLDEVLLGGIPVNTISVLMFGLRERYARGTGVISRSDHCEFRLGT